MRPWLLGTGAVTGDTLIMSAALVTCDAAGDVMCARLHHVDKTDRAGDRQHSQHSRHSPGAGARPPETRAHGAGR